MSKTFVCILFSLPSEVGGSQVVIYRHLKRLEAEGHHIIVVTIDHYSKSNLLEKNWQYIFLPKRGGKLWPPYRFKYKLLRNIRIGLLARYIINELDTPVDAVITLSWGIFPLVASKVAQKLARPLATFVHDEEFLFTKDVRKRSVLKNIIINTLGKSNHNWFVSEEMLLKYENFVEKSSVLLPISDNHNLSREDNDNIKERLVIGVAGRVHKNHIKGLDQLATVLNNLDGSLKIVTFDRHEELLRLASKHSNVELIEFFSTSKECLSFLSKSCSCLLVYYPEIGEQEWIKTSFPSKFLEYVQTGLPILVVAPSATSIYTWLQSRDISIMFETFQDERFVSFLRKLKSNDTWDHYSDISVQLAESDLNPHIIHEQFKRELFAML